MAIGKTRVRAAAKIQWVKLPKDCPLARCSLGKISEMNTQMIVPDPIAWEAMKTTMQIRTIKLTDPKSEEALCLTCWLYQELYLQ